MEFRPCIDIHNGKVKQIVGSSLSDSAGTARENFVSEQDAAFYARLYKEQGIAGGHIILLNPVGSEYYEATRQQALEALREYPGGLQVGGGITAENAASFIEAGASAVIVTSYVFRDGKIHYGNLDKLVRAVGAEHVVLDLSCRYKEDKGDTPKMYRSEGDTSKMYRSEGDTSKMYRSGYYIVTDRWQRFTEERVCPKLLDELSGYCAEFLVHAVDVEGKNSGIERRLAELLGEWGKIPITYAGGVHSFEDLDLIGELGKNRLNVTIGSALDLFGGPMSYEKVLQYIRREHNE